MFKTNDKNYWCLAKRHHQIILQGDEGSMKDAGRWFPPESLDLVVVWLWMEGLTPGGSNGFLCRQVELNPGGDWSSDVCSSDLLIAWGPDWLSYEGEGLAMTAWELRIPHRSRINRRGMLSSWFNFCINNLRILWVWTLKAQMQVYSCNCLRAPPTVLSW